MKAGEALLDAESVVGDVQVVTRGECFRSRDASVVVLAHLVRREVGVRAGAVPVTADRLRVKRRAHAVVLPHPVEEPARDPQLVADRGCVQRTDLEFPLTRHDLGVDPGDLQSGLKACVQMRLDYVAPEHLVGADAAVIATLGRRKPDVREAERPGAFEERVLLLDAEPGVESLEPLRHLDVRAAHVRLVRLAVDEHDLAQNELVVTTADRVRANEHRLQHAVRLVARRLLRARTVECPDWWLLAVRHDLRLGADLLRRLGAVDPDVFGSINAH